MLTTFKSHIKNHFPFLQNAKLLIACSGGLDSMVLSWLMHELRYEFGLAHCNFNLRGTESNEDEKFVAAFSKKHNIPIYIKSFDTKKEAQLRTGSIQMVARDLRYKWFKELLASENFDYVLTAHHADDSLETFLINLSRGTGINGLTGIPTQNGKILRPLLRFSRAAIMEYAIANKLLWREDSSNREVKYLRNKIRQEVVPLLKNLNPDFLDNFLSSQDKLKESSLILENTKKDLQRKLFVKEGGTITVSIKQLQKLEPLRYYIYLLFKEFGFTAWEDVLRLLQSDSGKEVASATHRLVKNREHLLLAPILASKDQEFLIDETQKTIHSPIELELEEVPHILETNKNTLYVDKERLIFPLVLRRWQSGDYFYPLGMKGKKKLSKYFKDEKLSTIAKEKQWLLCCKNEIIWVIGRRADQRYSVTKNTKRIIKITWNI